MAFKAKYGKTAGVGEGVEAVSVVQYIPSPTIPYFYIFSGEIQDMKGLERSAYGVL